MQALQEETSAAEAGLRAEEKLQEAAALRGVEHSPGDGGGSRGTRGRGGSRCEGRKFPHSREQPELRWDFRVSIRDKQIWE